MWQEFLQWKSRRHNLTPRLSRLLMGFPEQRIDQLNVYLYRWMKEIDMNKHVCNEIYECTTCKPDNTFIKQKRDLFKNLGVNNDNNRGKLYVLWQSLVDEYLIYREQRSTVPQNIKNVHSKFPLQIFQSKIEEAIALSQSGVQKEIWILQTFIPDFHNLTELLVKSIDNNIKVRILLMWTGSQFIKNREEALRKYAGISQEFDIADEVKNNLEKLEIILNRTTSNSHNLEVKLYDTIPTMSIYRCGDCILQGLFTHNNLAVNSFQIEIDMSIATNYVSDDIVNEFNTIWKMAEEDFSDKLRNSNWRNSLEELFQIKSH